MVTISLFDFEGPPEAINGETRALDSFDLAAFIPVGFGVKVGEKLTGGLLSQIGKFFATREVLPSTTKVLTGGGLTVARNTGAPIGSFGKSSIFSRNVQAVPFIAKPAANTIAKGSSFTFPKLVKGPVNSNLLTVAGITAGGFGITSLLTQTEGGQDLTENATDAAQSVSRFFSDNPLIVAGGIAVLGIMMLK